MLPPATRTGHRRSGRAAECARRPADHV